jgi:hypothetical protein
MWAADILQMETTIDTLSGAGNPTPTALERHQDAARRQRSQGSAQLAPGDQPRAKFLGPANAASRIDDTVCVPVAVIRHDMKTAGLRENFADSRRRYLESSGGNVASERRVEARTADQRLTDADDSLARPICNARTHRSAFARSLDESRGAQQVDSPPRDALDGVSTRPADDSHPRDAEAHEAEGGRATRGSGAEDKDISYAVAAAQMLNSCYTRVRIR